MLEGYQPQASNLEKEMPDYIIGFGHRSRVGKDTAAKFALQELRILHPGLKIEKRSFAWRLKEITHELFAWAGVREPAYYEENPEAREDPLPLIGYANVVELWVEVGNKMRQVFPDVWVRHVIHTPCDVLIIPDVRFENEVNIIREVAKDSMLIKVMKADAPIKDTESDNALEGKDHLWDIIIDNDDSLADLHENTVNLITEFVDA